ncbi:retrovirus-related Pol polyprotein from transposon TNT 1-94 [Nephila pilipes]|uniref:Retrovirus-related Pol polyprotein from transposon TNT 1-94 n=1 Tax=Nephila pilipes TaxID=299642 RepID=A0A8X6P7S6_NEPPI|nr:retrovirus-related Pol polyprotein from transposon TNT 1-94 [Nephila pilipes]
MSEDCNMNGNIAQMLELIDKRKPVREEIKDDHIAAARSENEFTPEFIKTKLTDECNRRMEQETDRNFTHAFKINVTFKRCYRNKNEKFCIFCKKSGHTGGLLTKRHNQTFGTNYDETFVPVEKHATIVAFLTAAIYKRMENEPNLHSRQEISMLMTGCKWLGEFNPAKVHISHVYFIHGRIEDVFVPEHHSGGKKYHGGVEKTDNR